MLSGGRWHEIMAGASLIRKRMQDSRSDKEGERVEPAAEPAPSTAVTDHRISRVDSDDEEEVCTHLLIDCLC